jgi:hypothetical protein
LICARPSASDSERLEKGGGTKATLLRQSGASCWLSDNSLNFSLETRFDLLMKTKTKGQGDVYLICDAKRSVLLFEHIKIQIINKKYLNGACGDNIVICALNSHA